MYYETLFWTDQAIYTAQYTGTNNVYSFNPISVKGISIISPRAAISNGSQAFWMDSNAFFTYNGSVVTHDQETVGAYIDDSVITSTIKTRLFDEKSIDSTSISVETLNGNVQLTGSVKNVSQKNTVESIALKVKGVRKVKNDIVIR